MFDIIDGCNMFVIPETPEEDRKTMTMATKYDGVGLHRPEYGIIEGAARSLSAAISRLPLCSENTNRNRSRAIIPCVSNISTPFCWKIDTSACKREW